MSSAETVGTRTPPPEIPAPAVPPSLRIPQAALPPYRFVPGRHPHPIKDPAGHMANAADPPQWSAEQHWTEDWGYLRGCDLFDHRFLWEAHEAWEGVWHQVPNEDPYREFLQGLIQAAASVLKAHIAHDGGAARLRARSTEKLTRVCQSQPMPYRGIDLPQFIARLHAFHEGGAWPTLPMARP